MDGDNLVYHCDKMLPEKARKILNDIAKEQNVKFEMDGFNTTRLIIPKSAAKAFFAAFNEDKVAQLTHPKEYEIRRFGGDLGLRH